MCGLKEIFEGAGNFFDKKVLANPTLHLEKLNLIRFIKALIKLFTPHMLRFAHHLLPEEKALKPFRQTFGLPPSLSGTAFEFGRLP